MSQTNPDATTDDSTDSQTDDDSPSLAERLAGIRERVDALESDDVDDMDDISLVELRSELKALEDAVEETRKNVADDELKGRMDVGENLYGLTLIESHNKYLEEDAGEVIMRAVSQGIDYTGFVQVNASTLADEHPDLAEIGEASYTYLR